MFKAQTVSDLNKGNICCVINMKHAVLYLVQCVVYVCLHSWVLIHNWKRADSAKTSWTKWLIELRPSHIYTNIKFVLTFCPHVNWVLCHWKQTIQVSVHTLWLLQIKMTSFYSVSISGSMLFKIICFQQLLSNELFLVSGKLVLVLVVTC